MAGPATTSLFDDVQATPPIAQQRGIYTLPSEGAVEEWVGTSGERFFRYWFEESLTVAGATATTTQLVPAGTVFVTVGIRVTTTLTGNSVANYDVGVTGSATLFATNYTSITAGDTCACGGTMTPALNAAAVGILITPDQTTTAGVMKVSVMCQGVRPPTS